ncbi:ACT domain-containing protein [Solibaculum mannosilyticum]|uniref:aspartate kinase n=1 Tax=Solibaculum mannosilyticum TaxID=2780922 RepID=A0A7I8D482_9FIRM|nr:hypothetical protein [Solibaculum mannosilyticum]MCO7137836.1 hypothetical protein [[Clostridium] leptum]BCI60309.1 hypothetical protein C12CBH8_09480 [Solibaculum mannosilyticum]CZT55029.1 Aspartokinase [Eubacteriaceae bacterium CHKCI005]
MKISQTVSITEDVTLITLSDSPADIHFISSIFDCIAEAKISVDMIAQSAPIGDRTSLSFTVSDDDMRKALDVVSSLRVSHPSLRPSISSGNVKVSVYSEQMRTQPGVASKVFSAAASSNVDIRLVTTSEVDISLLITKPEAETLSKAIESAFAE